MHYLVSDEILTNVKLFFLFPHPFHLPFPKIALMYSHFRIVRTILQITVKLIVYYKIQNVKCYIPLELNLYQTNYHKDSKMLGFLQFYSILLFWRYKINIVLASKRFIVITCFSRNVWLWFNLD